MLLPPLVEPAASLSAPERARYARHLVLPEIGEEGQRRLKAARVLVIGAGGLGAPIISYLAAAGVGTLGIVDFDVVEASNLHRQLLFSEKDCGSLKVHAAKVAVAQINPHIQVIEHPVVLTEENAVEIFANYHLIIDGSDNFATRYLVNDAATLAEKPYIWGALGQFSAQLATFWDASPAGVNLRDLYPQPPGVGTVPSCATGGVLGVMCGTIGSTMATEAIKLICGTGESLIGRVLTYDALPLRWRTFQLLRDPHRQPITELENYQQLCGDAPMTSNANSPVEINSAELQTLVASGEKFILIDVREPAEYAEGHISGSRLIPLATLAETLTEFSTTDHLVLYCQMGGRSAHGAAIASSLGFARVSALAGGLLAADLELVR